MTLTPLGTDSSSLSDMIEGKKERVRVAETVQGWLKLGGTVLSSARGVASDSRNEERECVCLTSVTFDVENEK